MVNKITAVRLQDTEKLIEQEMETNPEATKSSIIREAIREKYDNQKDTKG